jgi:hypothetical protein
MTGSVYYATPEPCRGCGKPLAVDNAWMEDGCPCNTAAGVNNQNAYRWHLLQQLQQRQSRELEAAQSDRSRVSALEAKRDRLREAIEWAIRLGSADPDGEIDWSGDIKGLLVSYVTGPREECNKTIESLYALKEAARPFAAWVKECPANFGDGWPLFDIMSDYDGHEPDLDLTVGHVRTLARLTGATNATS